MKTLIFCVLVMLSSCSQDGVKKNHYESEFDVDLHGIQTVIIDGCEYIVCNGSNAVAIVHKANCSNHK